MKVKKRGMISLLILMIILILFSFSINGDTFENRSITISESEALIDSNLVFSMNFYNLNFEYNNLNPEGDYFEKKLNLCTDLFFSSSGKLKETKGDFCNRIYVYEVKDSITFSYNYSILYIILLFYLYSFIQKYRRKHSVFVKKIMTISESLHGVNNFRFEVLIENNTNSNLYNCLVKDLVPSIFNIKEGGLGTIKPQVVSKGNKKELNFYVGDLRPKEKLLIYYYIETEINLSDDYIPDSGLFNYDKGFIKDKQCEIKYYNK